MNVFNKVTLESLKKNRTRTIVTIIGIMLSAAMICASTTLVSSMQNFLLRCAIHIDGDWYGAVYDAAYKNYEDIRDSDRVSSAAYAQVLGYAKIDSANERKPYLYVLGGDVASGYFKTMPVHLILGTLPKDSTEIILPEHLTSNGKVNYKLGDTVTLDVGDRTLDGRRLGQDTPVYTYDSETQVEIMSGERLENTEPRTYTVVGIYERPTFEDYSAPGYTALTAADTKSADQAPIHCYFKLHKPAGVYDFMKEMGYTQEYRYAYGESFAKYTLRSEKTIEEAPFFVSRSTPVAINMIYPYSMLESVIPEAALNQFRNTEYFLTSSNHTASFENLATVLTENGLSSRQLFDYAANAETNRNVVTIIRVFAYGFIVLISLIAAANVFNTISTNISLRRRKFAMLKSVGMTQKGFRRMMNCECLLYGSKALLLGLPVSCGITYLIYRAVTTAYETSFHLPWAAIGIAVLSVFLVVFATMMYSMSKVKKDNPIDALKNENL